MQQAPDLDHALRSKAYPDVKRWQKLGDSLSLALIKQRRQDDNLEGFLDDIQPLANAIATSKKPLIAVPTEIIRAAQATLSAWKKHYQFHVRETDDANSTKMRANDHHWHFIEKLEEALETLSPVSLPLLGQVSEEQTSAWSPSTSEALENQFTALPVEQPTELEPSGPATTSQTPLPSESHTFHEIDGAEKEEANESEDGVNLAKLPFALAHDILDKFCKKIGPSHVSLGLKENNYQLLHYCFALVSSRRSWEDRILLTKFLRIIAKQYPHLTSTSEPAADEPRYKWSRFWWTHSRTL
jgi:hypothetical protein